MLLRVSPTNLLVLIVVEPLHEHVDVTHDLQDVDALIQLPHRQVVVCQFDAKLVLR